MAHSDSHSYNNREEMAHNLDTDTLLLHDEDEELRSLLYKEQQSEPYNVFEPNSSLADERREAVEWMLSVVGYYSFSAVTAILAVNYLDRFLNSFHKVNKETKPWLSQLAAMASLSLAAKVEETRVPLLKDLQVEECKHMFEPKTIQRMEILILSTLQWKMHPVTAHSFLDYVAKRMGFLKKCVKREFLKRCECLLLSIVSDCRFMDYLPSTLASSVMLYVMSSQLEPCNGVVHDNQDQLMGILGINKDKVKDCCELIQEVVTSVYFLSDNKRKFGSVMPQSPKGVVDVCFSTDSRSFTNDSLELSSANASSVTSLPSSEPLCKKVKSRQDP